MSIDLSKIQGNILKGFDKPTVRFIFFHFGNSNVAKEWLRGVAQKRTLASTIDLLRASKQLKDVKKKDPSYSPQEIWLHVSLSFTAIKKFQKVPPYSTGVYEGTGEKTHVKCPDSKPKPWDPYWDPFHVGMKNPHHAQTLGDTVANAPELWVEPFKSGTYGRPENDKNTVEPDVNKMEIHALFIVASDNEDDGDSYALRLIEEATTIGITCIGIEKGVSLKNEQGKIVEHFGFRDGISQPLIRGVDGEKIDDEEIDCKRKINKDEFSAKDFVLHGLSGELEWANNGSFLVFRRLRQDVPHFWEFMNKKSKCLGLAPEQLAAMLVGRWKSGAPLAKHRYDPTDPKSSEDNDFVYVHNEEAKSRKKHPDLDDPEGERTAKFAHIRVGNPSDDDPTSNQHRILRRGIPYGPTWAETQEENQDDEADRGLLFVCYQRDLSQQFAYVQNQFIKNTPPYDEPNPLNPKPHDNIKNLLRSEDLEIGLRNWITTTGGEYFFSPSISALKDL